MGLETPTGSDVAPPKDKRSTIGMELTEMLSPGAWQKFESELFDHFFLNCTVYNANGIGITGKPN
jgi:hypothetical protein